MLRPTLRTLRTLKTLTTTTTTTRLHSTATTSVSPDELNHFSSLASSWWDPQGPSRVLHLMNPVRHDFIASCLAESTPITTTPSSPTDANKRNTLRYLDIGCGGGIFAESLARTIPNTSTSTSTDPASHPPTRTRAASITALDPSPTLIKIARDHARLDPSVNAHLQTGRFKYVNSTLEEYIPTLATASPSKDTFDVVTLFEVIEHIDNVPGSITPQGFLASCLSMVKPGGWLIGSTIARTFPSWIVNQVIAEAPWPVGVVPRGTHEWSKFVNPGELQAWVQEGLMRGVDGGAVRGGGEALEGTSWRCEGVVYFPGLGWKIVKGSESWGNYFWAVRKGFGSSGAV